MIIFDGELVILWKLSDVILLLFTAVLIQNLLFLLFFAVRKILERRLSMCGINGIMKLILWYALLLLPVIAGIVMFKCTYHRFLPLMDLGEGSLEKVSPVIGRVSFSSWTSYGNHWIFILILILWMAGAFVKGIIPYLRERGLLKRLKNTGGGAIDSKLVKDVRRLEREMGIRKPVEILEHALLSHPFITGCFRSRLYFPEMPLDEKERELMVRHELVHCRRRDSLYRRILFFLCSLYWFNPFMGLFAHYFVETSEMACDEEVLQSCSSRERKRYAELLVSFNQGESFLRQAVALTGHSESGLERRLKNMLKKENKRNKWIAMVMTVVVVSACPLMTVSASYGASVLQERAVKMLEVEVEEEMNGIENELTEEVDYEDMGEMRDLGIHLGARGLELIDETVSGKEAIRVSTVTLEKGKKITFTLEGDNNTAQFYAGYKDSSGKRVYVLSSHGQISHSFTMPKNDTYEIFIQGATSNTVHVTGSVMTGDI